ncbi:MAG: hypothetical protein ACRD0V_07225 [Acidimicrobiales bacterium]
MSDTGVAATLLDGTVTNIAVARVGDTIRVDCAAASATARPVGPHTVELTPAGARTLGDRLHRLAGEHP